MTLILSSIENIVSDKHSVFDLVVEYHFAVSDSELFILANLNTEHL